MPYMCEECGKTFSKLSHLKRHCRVENHQQSNLPGANGAEHTVDQSNVRNAEIEHTVDQSSVRNAATDIEHTMDLSSVRTAAIKIQHIVDNSRLLLSHCNYSISNRLNYYSNEHTVDQSSVRNVAIEIAHTVDQSSVRNVAIEIAHTVDQSSVRNVAIEIAHTVDQSSVRKAAIDLESLKLYFILFVTGVNKQMLHSQACDFQNVYLDSFLTLTYVGSTDEGVNRDYNSDIDIMCILNTVICYEDGEQIDEPDKYDLVIKADTSLSPPGYVQDHISPSFQKHMWELKELLTCIPKLLNMINGPATRFNSPSFSLGQLYTFKDYILKFGMIFLKDTEYSEEDLRIFLDEFYKQPVQMKFDFVIGVPFVSTKTIQSWENRKRKHGWPSKELIAELKQHGGHIVPVGLRGSSTEDPDWRISFAVIETNLIKSFNVVQLMTYRILKEIISGMPPSADLTSYHIKNLMLWLAESVDSNHFYPENLLKLIYVTLKILYKCVEKKTLPSYMIPAKNLFQNKLQDHHKILQELKNKIHTLVDEWDKSIYRKMFNFMSKNNIKTTGPLIFKSFQTIRQSDRAFYETFFTKITTLIVVFYMYDLFSLNLIKKLMNVCHLDPRWENLLDSLMSFLQTT